MMNVLKQGGFGKTLGVWVLFLMSALVLPMAGLGGSHVLAEDGNYYIGAGVYDITGPAAEVGMFGYAQVTQKTAGIHLRLWSRAFIIQDPSSGKRVVLVSADLGAITQGVKQKVIAKLKTQYGETYTDKNVLLSATHTHSGPGGYSHYALYNITSLGYIEQNFNCIVDGIYRSIVRAHNNLEPGSIKVNSGTLDGVTVNRSPGAYVRNPETERARYSDDVDKTMVTLMFENSYGQPIGTLNWFAIHGTSMGHHNLLISGDNKGYASYLYEKQMNVRYTDNKTFVAAFAQGAAGDVSPNIYGGEAGYGNNDFESTEYAGYKQYEKAKQLNDFAIQRLTGAVDYRHQYVNFSNINVLPEFANGAPQRTYPAAVGYSFAAGAEDGPSEISLFYEGMTQSDYPYGSVSAISLLQTFTGIFPITNDVMGSNYPELWEQHAPKPVLIATSKGSPYPWTPEVLPIQMLKIGQLVILGVPAEVTTMSGRRLKDTVSAVLNQPDGICVISALVNTYSQYVTTPEEYDAQHYEGASTLFGRWTLPAYQQLFTQLAVALKNQFQVPDGPTPIDLSGVQHTVQTGVIFDNTPLGKSFGSVYQDAASSYAKGATVTVKFWGGHPKNNLRIQSTYLEAQAYQNGVWTAVATDRDWETKYIWERVDSIWGTSRVTVQWTIPGNTPAGTYRIRHYGEYLNGWNGKVYSYSGTSRTFTVQ